MNGKATTPANLPDLLKEGLEQIETAYAAGQDPGPVFSEYVVRAWKSAAIIAAPEAQLDYNFTL